ncbi:tether containing UBX domain for GLUT4 isoform X3 [Mustela nigripes]|uniref:tether containing UBX domain for GLUT4 isoform X3 n=1 Tax=Mustela nigripes TaxID=77151 RepID=UPI0028162E92|nr:tether containing UBX domain for GLUT4 isoform X3 [Mustela nigripes]
MAAPAGGGGSAVSVLAPNGRRHTVKVTPSTVLLQVLEDTCRRQDFNPSEYDLKFQRNVLDLSLQWRFANLPNNAKLEMVPVSRSREGPENTVRIALQLDDGSRLQDTFCSGQTLWELLSHFAQTRHVCVLSSGPCWGLAAWPAVTPRPPTPVGPAWRRGTRWGTPRVVLNWRLRGLSWSNMIGNPDGNVLLLWHQQLKGQSQAWGGLHPGTSRSAWGHTAGVGVQCCTGVSGSRECLEPPSEASPVCVYMRDEVAGRASLKATTLKSLGLTGGSAIIRFAMRRCSSAGLSRSKAPGSPTASLSAGQAAGSPLPPLDSAGLSRGDVSHQDEADIPGAGRVDAPAKQISKEPAPAPFVPFSGGGQRLGGPSGSARPLMSPSAKLPKSFSSPGGPSKPKKSRPGQEPRPEAEPPVDRDPVVCHPDLEELLQAWPAELPDEFFEVTVDDVRRRLAQLRSERKRLEEAPLVTKAFREAQRREKLERYPKVVLRVLFPDRYILQGFFRPSETVGDLRAFVRSHLGDPELPFYLFITPPKTVLDDPTLTLFQADLFPAALVHFGAEEPTGACPGLLERHPRCQPLTLRPSSQSQRPRQGQWASLNPAPERSSQSGGIWGRSPSG